MGTLTPHVNLLGPPEILLGDQSIDLPSKSQGIISYLAASNRQCSRRRLAELLWPDVASRSARHSLSQALYVIRKTLGPNTLWTDSNSIALGNIDCDVLEFVGDISAGNWTAAAPLYRGVFAEHLSIRGAVDFEQWLDAQRTEFARLAHQVANKLAFNKCWTEARDLVDVILQHDQGNPNAVRVKVQALLGTSGASVAQRFAESLSGSAAAEASHIIATQEAARSHRLIRSRNDVFIGRVAPMEWLEERYEGALAGDTVLALIDGEAGIGKSVLMNRFSRLLALRGAKILTATAYPPEQNVPFGVVGQWLQDLSSDDLIALTAHPWMQILGGFFPSVGALLDIQGGPDPPEVGHHRLLESLRRMVVSIADVRPLMLALDDIHSADPASLSFIHYLLRRSSQDPLLLVATIRSDKDANPNPVRKWGNLATYVLDGFSRQEVAQFIERAAPAGYEKEIDIDRLVRQTGGNPLLLSTLVREGNLESEGASTPPQSIVDFFRPRLLQRSREARQLLAILAILGEPCDAYRLHAVSGLKLEAVEQALGELRDGQLVASTGAQFSLRHGLVGEVALSLQSAPEKQRLHGRAARLLAGEGVPPSPLVAFSHDLAGNREKAFDASMEASKACDVLHAHTEKEYFLKLALGNAPSAQAGAQVRIELAEHHLKQRHLADALQVLDLEAFSNVADEISRRAEVMRLRVMAEMTGDVDVLKDLWRQARKATNDLSPLVLADTYTHIGGVAYDLGLDDIAAEVAELIVDRLSELPLTEQTALRLVRPTAFSGFLRGYSSALDKLEKLPQPGGRNPAYSATFHVSKAALLVAAGRLTEAEDLFAVSMGITERFALFDHFHVINNNLGVCLMEQGRYEKAEVRLTEATNYAADTSPSEHSISRDNLTILAYERGAYESAVEAATEQLGAPEVSGGRAVMSLLAILGLSALEIGDLARCREAERELQVRMQRYGGYSNDMSYVHIFLARMMAFRRKHKTAIETLAAAGKHYRSRNLLAGLRMDIERCRLQLRSGVDCSDTLIDVMAQLEGKGAVPLNEKAQRLETRLKLRRG